LVGNIGNMLLTFRGASCLILQGSRRIMDYPDDRGQQAPQNVGNKLRITTA